MQKRWVVRQADEKLIRRFSEALEMPPLISRLLIHRGKASVEEAQRFLCDDLSSLSPPERMKDLPIAVGLIREAIRARHPILIVGDYDVDGLTSSALLIRVLRGLGAEVSSHIPHRMNDGYGLKTDVIRKAAAIGVKLLMTVDCGTTSFKELDLARHLRMQTIVVDHHELLPQGSPPAEAFLNPLQPQCRYPEKNMASVGVAFTLARGLAQQGFPVEFWDHLDLAALGTVADVAPLVGENRILVKAGLHRLGGTRKAGLKALIASAKLQPPLTAEDISFGLAPRLNAVGRTGSAGLSLELLLTEDAAEAFSLAKRIEQENKNRRVLERTAFKRALWKVDREVNFAQDRVIVLDDDRWHPGVVGILANRLAHRFNRPAVVIAMDETRCRGSARSIHAFHLVEALEQVKEHLIEFGGHPGAAGLTIARDRIDSFRQALNQVAHQMMDPEILVPMLDIDAELPLAALTPALMRDLEVLAPFGAGNPRPIFFSQDARLGEYASPQAYSPRGVRFLVEDAQGRSFEALQPRFDIAQGWNVRRLSRVALHMAYSPVRRVSQDAAWIELKLCDLKVNPKKKVPPV